MSDCTDNMKFVQMEGLTLDLIKSGRNITQDRRC